MSSIVLNRAVFIREMRAGILTNFTLLIASTGDITLQAQNKEGSVFTLGYGFAQPRIWTNPVYPFRFLRDSGIREFTVQIEKESD